MLLCRQTVFLFLRINYFNEASSFKTLFTQRRRALFKEVCSKPLSHESFVLHVFVPILYFQLNMLELFYLFITPFCYFPSTFWLPDSCFHLFGSNHYFPPCITFILCCILVFFDKHLFYSYFYTCDFVASTLPYAHLFPQPLQIWYWFLCPNLNYLKPIVFWPSLGFLDHHVCRCWSSPAIAGQNYGLNAGCTQLKSLSFGLQIPQAQNSGKCCLLWWKSLN